MHSEQATPARGAGGPAGHRPPRPLLSSLGRARVSGIAPHTLSYLERQGGRRGGAAPAGLEGRTVPAEPGAAGPRGGARALSAPRGRGAAGRRLGSAPGPRALSAVGSLGLRKGAPRGVPSLRAGTGRTVRPGSPARRGAAAAVGHAGSRARGSAWPGLPPSTRAGGGRRGAPATGGSASAPPPRIQGPGFLLALRGSRATGGSWRRGPTARPRRGRASPGRGPEGPARRGAGPGTGERAALLRAPRGRGPGWSRGGAHARRGRPQLHEEEGCFRLLVPLGHGLRGARLGPAGPASDLQGCEGRQRWAGVTWPHGSTTA